MSQKLPYKNFKWSNDLTLDKITNWNIRSRYLNSKRIAL